MARFDIPLEILTYANPVDLADSRQKELHFDQEWGCLWTHIAWCKVVSTWLPQFEIEEYKK